MPNPIATAAIAAIYQAHAPGLLAFLTARLRDGTWAEDILHDLFIAMIRQNAAAIADPRAYLFSAAHRLSLNALRDRAVDRRVRELIADEPRDWQFVPGSDPLIAAEAQLALRTLPDVEREVLALRVFAGLSFAEIAVTLDRAQTSVFRDYQQAVATLRVALDGQPQRSRGH